MEQLSAATQRGHDAEKGPQYVCQATELLRATQPIGKLDVRHWAEDYRSGNMDVATMLRGALYRVSDRSFVAARASGVSSGSAMRLRSL